MEKKSTVWIILCLLMTTAAGTGFFMFSRKNTEVAEQKARLDQIVEDLTVYRNKNRALEEQVQQSQDNTKAQETIAELTKKLQATEAELQKVSTQGDKLKELQSTIDTLTQQIQAKEKEFQTLTTQKDAALQQAQEQKATLEKTLQQLTQENTKLTGQMQVLEQAGQDLKVTEKVVELSQKVTELDTTNRHLETRLTEKDALLAQQETRIQELTQQVKDGQQDLQKRLSDLTTAIKDGKTTGNEAWRTELEQQIQSLTKKLEEAQQAVTLQEKVSELTLQLAELTARDQGKDQELLAMKQQLAAKETALTEAAAKDQKIAALETALKEKEAALAEAANAGQVTDKTTQEQMTKLQEENAALEKQRQEQDGQLKQLTAQLTEIQAKVTSLEQEVSKREAEYQQQNEQHNQMIQKLQEDIASGSMEKETIQKRLQDELDRSKQDFQKRLDQLAQEKEQQAQEVQKLQSLATTYEKLAQDLKKEIDEKTVTLEQYKEQLTVNIVDKILFASGQATVNAEGRKVLNKIGELLKQNIEGRQIRVEGHTDNIPIGDEIVEKYPSNWELSTARAVNVVHYLQDVGKIPASKLSAAGYGEYRPIADNATKEGRAMNRRIEIVLMPELERKE